MSTTKLTRAEACAELARRLGWTCDNTLGSFTHKLWRNPNQQVDYPENWQECPPDYFTSRDAAAELVTWLLTQSEKFGASGVTLLAAFCSALVVRVTQPTDSYYEMQARLIAASAEAQTFAVCAALGLEVEDVK